MALRCTRCLDDGLIRHADGEEVCDCRAGRAHAIGLEVDARWQSALDSLVLEAIKDKGL